MSLVAGVVAVSYNPIAGVVAVSNVVMNGIGSLNHYDKHPLGPKLWVGSSGLLARRSSIEPYILGYRGPWGMPQGLIYFSMKHALKASARSETESASAARHRVARGALRNE